MLDPGRTSYADDAVQPSPSEAARFLTALDDGGKFTFQSFDDNAARGNKRLAQIRHGSLKRHWPELVQLNARGAGIFVTVNATDLEGRKTENVTAVRALFVDFDGAPLDPATTCSTPPHLIVESSPGRWHCYWLVSDVPLALFKPMQKALAARFNGDPGVHDLPRVLRLPGFVHQKGAPFLSLLQDIDPRPPYTFEQMRAAFPPAPEPEPRPEPKPSGKGTDRRRGEAWARKALDASAHELANAGEGTRHETLLKKATRMGTMIARGWIDTQEVRRALYAAAESNGQIKRYGVGHFNDALKSGIAHGTLTPHPDLPDNDPPPAAATPPPGDKTKEAKPPPAAPSLLVRIDLARYDSEPVPAREWGVPDRFPRRAVCLLSGEGGRGKSITLLQLAAAHVLAKDWLRSMPEPGPVVLVNAEDEEGEIIRRVKPIVEHYGASFADVARDLHIFSLAGADPLLAVADRSGRIVGTALYAELMALVRAVQPICTIIDNVADVFGANEIERSHVRQFIALMRQCAIAGNGYVIMSSHPSLTGLASKTGLSGSTQWHNSVRARAWMHGGGEANNGEASDPDLRVLEFLKSNYSALAETLTLRWQDGLYVPVSRQGFLDEAAAHAAANEMFLGLLDRFTRAGDNVSNKPSSNNYAPARFAAEDDAKTKHLNKAVLAAAMRRLFTAEQIAVEPYGPPSRDYRRIIRKAS